MEVKPVTAKGQRSKEDRKRYITPREVSMHNRPDDCWVSFLGRVYDITAVIKKEKDTKLTLPIINVSQSGFYSGPRQKNRVGLLFATTAMPTKYCAPTMALNESVHTIWCVSSGQAGTSQTGSTGKPRISGGMSMQLQISKCTTSPWVDLSIFRSPSLPLMSQ